MPPDEVPHPGAGGGACAQVRPGGVHARERGGGGGRADESQPGLQPVHVGLLAQETGVDQRCRLRVRGCQPQRAAAVRGDHRGHQREPCGRCRVPGRGDRQQDREQVQVGAGPGQLAAQRRVYLPVVVPAAGQRPGYRVARHDDGVVLEVLPDPGQVGDRADAQGAQLPGRADPGQQEQLRGADRARAHDHLPAGVRLRRYPVAEVADPGAPAVPHVQAGGQAAGLHGQVAAVQDGPQVGAVRADPLPRRRSPGPPRPRLLAAAR